MDQIVINIARDYTVTPGSRYRRQGEFSGEDFREEFLEEHFDDPSKKYKIVVVLDGTAGYATSFLEESFGGLARIFGVDEVEKRIEIVSEEEPLLIDEVREYIRDAKK